MKSKTLFAVLVTTGSLYAASPLLRASEMDNRIEASAGKTHVFKTYLKADSIRVESKEGVVTLTGTVAEKSHRTMAEDTIEGLPGVKRVDNQLNVAADAPAEHSDAWIQFKVKTALLFHRNVSATRTEVEVQDGMVTLRGEASSLAQKELTTEYTKDLENVKGVNNLMTLSKAPTPTTETLREKVDDASITAQVKAALLSHRSTSVLKTKVHTLDGVVTVSGVARNAAEKSLVTKLVSDVDGVVSVVNEMSIPIEAASKD